MTTRIAIGFALLILSAACTSTGSRTQSAVARNLVCPTHSASRIVDNTDGCASPGSSYSEEDLRRTGRTNAGEALQMLDPSITVHR